MTAAASFLALAVATLSSSAPSQAPEGAGLRVGSKRFTESYLLAEMAVAVMGEGASHLQGLGGTAIAFRALEQGSIDLYPEYTGTISEEILRASTPLPVEAIRAQLAARGLGITAPLGFSNTYALAVRPDARRGEALRRISELPASPDLRVVLSHEFFGRRDGWPSLVRAYGLGALRHVEVMDHGLAYAAVAAGEADLTDGYSTDPQLARYGLTTLEDDRRAFPRYQAVFLYRLDAERRRPSAFARLRRLEGRLDAETMTRLNGEAEEGRLGFDRVARSYLASRGWGGASSSEGADRPGLWARIGVAVREQGPRHLLLVGVALGLATALGIPLGILASRRRALGQLVLGAAGLVQTLPSLALLCFFIPLWGTGLTPALAALFLYGLLPIVRNTVVGLRQIPTPLVESAQALGLPAGVRLGRIYLPLAAPMVIAGVKTAAVIGVGTATLAAFIGAGGFGQPISVGLNLNDTQQILAGAIPAAGLALLIQGFFELLERWWAPRGLRATPG